MSWYLDNDDVIGHAPKRRNIYDHASLRPNQRAVVCVRSAYGDGEATVGVLVYYAGMCTRMVLP